MQKIFSYKEDIIQNSEMHKKYLLSLKEMLDILFSFTM